MIKTRNNLQKGLSNKTDFTFARYKGYTINKISFMNSNKDCYLFINCKSKVEYFFCDTTSWLEKVDELIRLTYEFSKVFKKLNIEFNPYEFIDENIDNIQEYIYEISDLVNNKRLKEITKVHNSISRLQEGIDVYFSTFKNKKYTYNDYLEEIILKLDKQELNNNIIGGTNA